MIDKKFSTKRLKSILKRNRGLADHNLIHPEREWHIGIGFALVTLAAGTTWAIHLYLNFAQITPQANEANTVTYELYREGEIARALEELSERTKQNEAIQQQLEQKPALPSFVTIPEPVVATEVAEVGTTSPTGTPDPETLPPGPLPAEAL